MKNHDRHFGSEIARLRADRGMSLQDVAGRARLSKTHVWDLEQGRSINPTVLTVSRIADALGTTPEKLLLLAADDARCAAPANPLTIQEQRR